jgi:hypothetical protein
VSLSSAHVRSITADVVVTPARDPLLVAQAASVVSARNKQEAMNRPMTVLLFAP